MAKSPKDDDKPTIIIKKVKKVSGGHHGGAWKVAYADFVTAMMAFFLLLWLLNVTTDEQKSLISNYFSPADPRIAESLSGSGGVMGGLTMSSEGAMTDDQVPPVATPGTPSAGAGKETGEVGEDGMPGMSQDEEAQMRAKLDQLDTQKFNEVREQIEQAISDNPDLSALKQNLMIDMTPEGLRIQIVDQEGKPMFPIGSYVPFPEAIKLMQLVVGVIKDLPNKISVRGHTDSKPYTRGATYGNWELSSDRANASRRVLLDGGLDIARVENVQGKADRENLDVNDPFSARNRRISIILLKQSLVAGVPQDEAAKARAKAEAERRRKREPELRKREEGIIYFP